ncbi:MAG TPA: response regulator transcription factor [Azospirillaceae bacterium]|nr:response regulator transcription factor [Azospirillaceae bacterium]
MRILVGDDHLLFREGLRRLLEQLTPDATFVDASTFDEVMDEASPNLDLVLIDLQMPGWPGFEGIETLRERLNENAPVVVVSASESVADMRAALAHGASGYIPKSSSVKVMLSALNLVFSGGIYVPPAALMSAGDAAFSLADGPAGGGNGTATATRPGNAILTQRQWEVLNCLREGKSNKQIAYELGLSEGTVKIHVTAIFKSLGVKNRTQAVIAAAEMERS